MLFLKRKRKRGLDEVLLNWSKRDAFTVRDLLNGGVSIMGRTGSGKTSSSGRLLGFSIVAHRRSSGLIVSAKPEDREMWTRIFTAAGRLNDLKVMDASAKLRCNVLAYELRHGADTRDLTHCITVIADALKHSDNRGGGDEGAFWELEQERCIYNSIEVVKQARGTVSAPDLQRFISGAAASPAQIHTEEWKAGFHNQCLRQAFEKHKSRRDTYDFDLAASYWLGEWPGMADKTRSSINTGVMGLLHVFCSGMCREILSTDTNVSPDDMADGKWLLIDMPVARYGQAGAFVNAAMKYITQRAVLRRHATPDSCINVIWLDEAQLSLGKFDPHYLAQCRSHMGCMVCLTQSLPGMFSAMKGEHGQHQINALMSSFTFKVFHALGDVPTAEFASGLVGRGLRTFYGGSTPPDEDVWGAIMGMTNFTGSFNQHMEKIIEPNVFLSGMRTGGAANGFLCDAVVVKSGEPFASGRSFLKTAFSQR